MKEFMTAVSTRLRAKLAKHMKTNIDMLTNGTSRDKDELKQRRVRDVSTFSTARNIEADEEAELSYGIVAGALYLAILNFKAKKDRATWSRPYEPKISDVQNLSSEQLAANLRQVSALSGSPRRARSGGHFPSPRFFRASLARHCTRLRHHQLAPQPRTHRRRARRRRRWPLRMSWPQPSAVAAT